MNDEVRVGYKPWLAQRRSHGDRASATTFYSPRRCCMLRLKLKTLIPQR